MYRRTVLAGAGIILSTGLGGCVSRIRGGGGEVSTEFEEVEDALSVDEPPDVSVSDETISAHGTIQYGSSSCGTVELAHAEYEASQERLDILVVAADDSGWTRSCTDDLVATGYRVTATVDESLRRVAVTEHHVFGDTYSTTLDLTDS